MKNKIGAIANFSFAVFFALYTLIAILLLLLGLGSAFATAFAPVRATFESWGSGTSVFELMWRAMARASTLSESTEQIAIDYALSVLNIAFGIFIVWRRPRDLVARLLAIAMVGTAMAFNFQSHGVLAVGAVLAPPRSPPPLLPLSVFHYLLHAISGATYLHALLVFPNGKLAPRKLFWFLVFIYGLMIQEIAFPILKTVFGRALFIAAPPLSATENPLARFAQLLLNPNGGGLVVTFVRLEFGIGPSLIESFGAIIRAETLLFILFFGLLIPLVGVTSQIYRYRKISNDPERAQTKWVVWALTLAFGIGLAIFIALLVSNVLSGEGLTPQALDQIEEILSRLLPPLYAVIPIVLFIAILRFHLFDIDLLINRTLVYAALTAILAGIFAALSNLLQRLFLAITGAKSDTSVILSALIVATAFAPIRSIVQKTVDKRLQRFLQTEPVRDSSAARDEMEMTRNLLATITRAFNAGFICARVDAGQ
ncbi:MAG: hypothetical protein HY070_05885 [Chloroflexi bacterium]|nr:hypothetical protein [Chloroflexota bacterium]